MMNAFSQALKSMRRSPYQAAAALLLVFVTFFVGYALTLFLIGSQKVLVYFETRPQVTAFFQQDTEPASLEAFAGTLRSLNYVREVRVITQEQALEIYKQQAGDDPLLLELVTADILPPSLEVSTVTLNDLSRAAEELGKLEGIDEVVYQKDIVDSLRYWTVLLRKLGVGLVSVFSLTAILVIMVITSVRVASHKGEIRIMRLIGATKWYIQQPFLLEGMLYGFVGSLLAWGAVYIALLYASPTIQEFFGEVQIVPVPVADMALLLAGGVTVGMCIGIFSSFLSTRRLFRV